jgi:hypothetical protein
MQKQKAKLLHKPQVVVVYRRFPATTTTKKAKPAETNGCQKHARRTRNHILDATDATLDPNDRSPKQSKAQSN